MEQFLLRRQRDGLAMVEPATGKPADGLIARKIPGSRYWAVFRGQEQVSGRGVQSWALDRLEELVRQSAIRSRDCITCKRAFFSEGAHNRMCDRCRQRGHESRRW